MSSQFVYSLTIKPSHLDVFGHVNNAVYLMLLEEARWDILNKNNYGIDKIQATGLGPVILEIRINFLKELHVGDQITIETRTISYKNKISKMSQIILRGEEICSTAELVMGLFDLKARKLVLPTPEWLRAVGWLNT